MNKKLLFLPLFFISSIYSMERTYTFMIDKTKCAARAVEGPDKGKLMLPVIFKFRSDLQVSSYLPKEELIELLHSKNFILRRRGFRFKYVPQ